MGLTDDAMDWYWRMMMLLLDARWRSAVDECRGSDGKYLEESGCVEIWSGQQSRTMITEG